MPKIRAELRDRGDAHFEARWAAVGRNRIARLMRQLGLRGVSRRRGFTVTTERDPNARPAPDLVNRQFAANRPNELWVSDITYVPTWAGFIFLAIVLDAWSRKIVGWSIGYDLRTELVIEALNMALAQRDAAAVIHHSDQGSQYTSVAFGRRQEMGVMPSMGTVGDAYDNAMAESFFASLECELLDRRVFKSKQEARVALFTYIEGWYNPASYCPISLCH
jgi:putative transposase